MRAGQREARHLQVIELCIKPSVRGVACFASRGKIQRLVIGFYRFLEVRSVARNAIRG